ncbi:MAG: PAS domain-containing protein [Alphaproteobacteria bacterium]|nr:PAS domain-containing protein [Alphaproteobacteria bacterium]MBU6471773.1 PAS domain-containing protein [Alphaproteobacteria bacterium]MDE2011718.1 PAS domain-containing protein [Alphaproteobacteria bacterium]MDE2074803.1 PAS domain-containing protein [Alphaproteobacteria bacterium]MDE2352354.1 PAS domain-containing protein [Alphaproteobacteria bacterium]
MTRSATRTEAGDDSTAIQIAQALPMPVLLIGPGQEILFVNPAAEQFFGMGSTLLRQQRMDELIPFGSPLIPLIAQARERNASVGERDVDLTTPKLGEKLTDISVTPVSEPQNAVLIVLQERSLAQRMDRQLLHRGAVRSLHGMAAVLAHEIKNPLAGIRGAAQLLEEAVPPSERNLTELICDETDRIRGIIDRMEAFGDTRAFPRVPVNIHEVLDRVRKVAETGFARHVVFNEVFDPSLPPVLGDRDQLIQVFLNLVRNACDALPETGGEITLTTGYRPGVRVSVGPSGDRISLPLEVTVRDNGAGVPPDLMPYIFDPFVTTKTSGTGLGLALVAKIVGDHGGVIECDSIPHKTVFRVLLPKAGQGEMREES